MRGSAGLRALAGGGAQYAVLDAAGAVVTTAAAWDDDAPRAARTRDVLLVHRWLRAAQAGDPEGGLQLGVLRGCAGPWRVCAPVVRVPVLPERECRRGDALRLLEAAPGPALRDRARLRVTGLLACAGLDRPAARSLLRAYEGFFPGVEVGVAWSLHDRLCARGRSCLHCLDLRSLTWDLLAGASLWTLPETGGGRWPAGVHLFSVHAGAETSPGRRGRRGPASSGPSIPHASPH
ncbi:MAG TPA: hypothetical protein VGB85_02830 [Nannocystis sp.]